MIQAALWGNATDLSLLVDLKYEDLQKLQAVGKAAQAAQAAKVLRDDLPKVWALLKTVKDGQVDIVLDNGGSHVNAGELIHQPVLSCIPIWCLPTSSSRVRRSSTRSSSSRSYILVCADSSPKTVPWFVSDVLPYDFGWVIFPGAD